MRSQGLAQRIGVIGGQRADRVGLAYNFVDDLPNFRASLTIHQDCVFEAPLWLNGSTSTMRDWRSWVQFPWVTSIFNVDIARILVFYLAMVRNCCGLLWRRSCGCSYLPYTMSVKAVRWLPLDRDRCTLYEINKSMFNV